MNRSFHLVAGNWLDHKKDLTDVRRQVFIVEQQVPEALELDDHDVRCHHVLVASAEHRPVGAGRIKPNGHIGRMAVLKNVRGQGVGTAMLNALLGCARQQGIDVVYLYAQISAIPFYEKSGFVITGDPFMDAGMLHRRMVLNIK